MQTIFLFLFFILRAHGWFVSAWHSDALLPTPPNRANAVCDLLAKSLTTPSHRRPSSSGSLHIFPPCFSHFSVVGEHRRSLTLTFSLFGTAPPRLSSLQTHTQTHILYIFTRRRHTFHCLDITHLGRLLSVGCKWHWEIFVRVCDHCLSSGRPVQAAGWGCAAVGVLRKFLNVKKISLAWYDTKSWESVFLKRQMLQMPSFHAFFSWLYKEITATELSFNLNADTAHCC